MAWHILFVMTEKFGSLDNCSEFPFENCMGSLKKPKETG